MPRSAIFISFFSYFEGSGQDPSLFELERLEESVASSEAGDVSLEMVANKRKLLRKQLDVVCRMLSDSVLQNSTSFQDELARVIELQNSLKEALEVATTTRRCALAPTEQDKFKEIGWGCPEWNAS